LGRDADVSCEQESEDPPNEHILSEAMEVEVVQEDGRISAETHQDARDGESGIVARRANDEVVMTVNVWGRQEAGSTEHTSEHQPGGA
jgi:hypothetical protein